MSSEVKRKGKVKKEKRYLSVILVPHSQDNVKVLKLASARLKFSILAGLIFSVFLGLIGLTVYTKYDNQKLNKRLDALTETTIEQKNMLSDKADEIKSLMDKYNSLNKKAEAFTELYKDMADNYLEKEKNGQKASRSGDRNERSFVDDISRLKNILNSINETYNSQSEAVSDLAKTEEELEKYIGSIPTLWPAKGRISSTFGSRSDPFNNAQKLHKGLDIAADEGSDIVASADGVVVLAEYYGSYGNTVIINHGHGISTLYAHTSRILVKEGKKVKKGDLIAKVGSTGRSTGAHLHFEVRINDVQVDPMKYLDN
jgi:murein DD-endopeptidase MepM/ murein hydrolase activator NlpD